MGLAVFAAVVTLTILFSIVALITGRGGALIGWLLATLLIAVAGLRIYSFISGYTFLSVWAGIVLGHNIVVFFQAKRYRDPADEGDLSTLISEWGSEGRIKILHEVPVYRDPEMIVPCVESILRSAWYISDFVDTTVVVIDDASPDRTLQVLWDYVSNLHNVYVEVLENGRLETYIVPESGYSPITLRIMPLSQNGKKKRALACGQCGGENWEEAFNQFFKLHNRKPDMGDYEELMTLLREIGCYPIDTPLTFHTDSDSILYPDYHYYQLMAFSSNPNEIGAVSGHCDVMLGDNPSTVTLMQDSLYPAQFGVRKAAESGDPKKDGAVFCVSGPVALFLSSMLLTILYDWVHFKVLGVEYPGATDRKATEAYLKEKILLVNGGKKKKRRRFKVVYTRKARAFTKTPRTLWEERAQRSRWKMNYWAVLLPVALVARNVPPLIAFLTYTRLIITAGGPFILWLHIDLLLQGQFIASLAYLAGILGMGLIWGIASLKFTNRKLTRRQQIAFVMRRMLVSLISAIWGAPLTLRALFLHFKRGFAWREPKTQRLGGRFINRWFTPFFELRYYEAILIFQLGRKVIELFT